MSQDPLYYYPEVENFNFFRGLLFALALSVPFWAVIGFGVYRYMRGGM